MKRREFLLLGTGALAGALVPSTSWARRYLSVEQAQALMFPQATLEPVRVLMTREQAEEVELLSGVPVRTRKLAAWRTSESEWFLVDEVIGKHEYITWALSLDSHGAVRQVEILDYRESYGGEVRNRKWREQFGGLSAEQMPIFEQNVRNISGATMSCSHLTDGVRRLLATHEVVLRTLA